MELILDQYLHLVGEKIIPSPFPLCLACLACLAILFNMCLLLKNTLFWTLNKDIFSAVCGLFVILRVFPLEKLYLYQFKLEKHDILHM